MNILLSLPHNYQIRYCRRLLYRIITSIPLTSSKTLNRIHVDDVNDVVIVTRTKQQQQQVDKVSIE